MIPIEYYVPFYYFLLSIVLIFSVAPLFFGKSLWKANFSIGTILLILVPILFIGLRDPYGSWRYLGDTYFYTNAFNGIRESSYEIKSDKLFYSLMYLFSKITNVKVFYILCSICYVLLPFYLFKNIEKKHVFILLALHVCSFSYWNFGANGLRNGLGVALFLYALIYSEVKTITFYGLALISAQLHASMYIPLLGFIVSHIFVRTKVYLSFWLFTIPITFIYGKRIQSFIDNFISQIGLSDSRLETYSNLNGAIAEVYQTTSFRLDFLIYSALPVLLGYLLIFKYKYFNQFYTRVFNSYLLLNGVWILLMYRPFTNRIAYLSWFLIPVLFYPLLEIKFFKKQSSLIGSFLLINLFLTLFLFFK